MKKKILIIEDNVKNMMLEKDLLEVEGFEVLEAKDGASGIDLAKKEKPDGIVLDVQLPDMRGLWVVKSFQERPETRDIPIIFVTASVVGEAMEEIRTIPNTTLITKPINTRTFAKEISQCVP